MTKNVILFAIALWASLAMAATKTVDADFLQNGSLARRNYIRNGNFERDAFGTVSYADAAGSSPVDGTGGSPVLTCTRTASTPLRGDGTLLITKDASNRQGNGCGLAFTIDVADKGKPLTIEFDYTVASGTYASGDLGVFIYDVTNTALITVTNTSSGTSPQIPTTSTGVPAKYYGTFTAAASSTSYRLIVHARSTSSSAYTVKIDNIGVSENAAANLAGGSAGCIPYFTAANLMTCLAIGSSGNILSVSGSLPAWSSSAGTVTSVATGTGLTGGTITTTGTISMANMAAHTYKGNNTGSTAAPDDISRVNLAADLQGFGAAAFVLEQYNSVGTNTFTFPAGTTAGTKFYFKLVGPGGGGGGAATGAGTAGGGGGAGGTCWKTLTGMTAGNTVLCKVTAGGTIGADTGGSGGTPTGTTLESGTQSITTVTASGGSGGAGNTSVGTPAQGGTGGGCTNATIGSGGGGEGGDSVQNGAASLFMGGYGGASSMGGGGRQIFGGAAGRDGTAFGSGGSGGATNGGNRAGGLGAQGYCEVSYAL